MGFSSSTLGLIIRTVAEMKGATVLIPLYINYLVQFDGGKVCSPFNPNTITHCLPIRPLKVLYTIV